MNSIFFTALGLVFVFEGLLPFLLPNSWRRLMAQMMMQNNRVLRMIGFFSMLLGLIIIYLSQ